MATIKVTRTALVLALIASACENEPLPPDGTPDAGTAPDDVQPLLATSEPDETSSRVQGFQVPEDGDNPPAPPLDDRVRARAELAALEAELLGILDPVLARLDERGITREQLEQAVGDVRAERALLGLSLPEYHELQRRIESVVERARPLLDVPRPLTRDGRGGGEEICTTETTVDELDDGTIVITDTESCRPGFPEDGGSSGGCLLGGPGCSDGPGGGNSSPDFATECRIEGGKVENGRCECARGSKCKDALFGVAVATAPCLVYWPFCSAVPGAWVMLAWQCNQRPCDVINRKHSR